MGIQKVLSKGVQLNFDRFFFFLVDEDPITTKSGQSSAQQ